MARKRGIALAGLLLFLIVAGAGAGGLESPLPDAAEKQNSAAVRKLVGQGVDVNQAQVDGMTALHWAAHHDDLETARFLVAAKADVKRANRYEVTPLSLACTNGNAAMVELLLGAGADPNTRLRGGETVLMTAARTGKLGPVRALLARGADVDARERRGQTALMWAAADGHAAVVEALLAAHADFRTPLPSGFTPLFFAVREGRADVVRLLLKAGADVNEAMQPKKNAGRGPARGTSPLILAVENGHFDLAVELLKAGADPNDQRSGFTALHMMSWVRKPNRGDGLDDAPPPIGSGTMTNLDFVRELAARGANVDARLAKGAGGRSPVAKSGATPFLMACVTADVPFLRTLLELGADPSTPNSDGCTPLMAAAGVGSLAPGEEAGTETEAYEAVQLALELGGDVNTVDANGETAMHGAAYKSLPSVVQLLADRGAKIEIWNRRNKRGWTPLMIAEGHRPGNFKPSPETIVAIQRVMAAAGVAPPTDAPQAEIRKGYEADSAAKPTP
ncbi:ankyrin repeat domain-containing protein [Paludisphaera mucosa]|uniref:Ankyrin repeat domain-containing protein n=1 Tax=Paludisphaera mucosa TaxID=3030827 RepID=A0ABT6FEY4_9BACT|nr:ankyrin repeat domain-containing protein [Paludisphaera mucosa]MDG3006140.1 ankyrin repeat domain-containing protein [Paludisphaera mucosa]